jgi:uncharacterized membrane protein HdeD (DUF308 family)
VWNEGAQPRVRDEQIIRRLGPFRRKIVNTIDKTLKRSSRMLAFMGVASIAFGVIVAVWPGISLLALLALFGAFALVTGALSVGAGLEHIAERRTDWVPYLLTGLCGIAVGLITFFRPGVTGVVLLYLIAGFAIVTGTFSIAAAFDLWDETNHQSWMLGLSGLLSIAFGILIAVYPVSGALAILWLIAFYAIVVGTVELIYAVRIHQTEHRLTEMLKPHRAAS